MASTDVELRDANLNGEYVSNEPASDDQSRGKPPLHKRLLNLFTRRVKHRPSLNVDGQPDYLEHLLNDADRVLGTDLGTNLRRDYVHIKDRAGVELINSLIWFECFTPQLASWRGYLDKVEMKLTSELDLGSDDFSPTGTFSECLNQFQHCLESPHSDCLQLCVIASESPLVKTTMSSDQTLAVTLSGSAKDKTHLPKQAIISLLAHSWLLLKPVILELLRVDFSAKRHWQLKLPSKDGFNCTPNLLDPFEVNFTLSWQSEAPKYFSDLDIYVWQRYRKFPRCQNAYLARLFTVDQRAQRIIIRLDSTAQLVKYKEQRYRMSPPDSSVHPPEQWSVTDELSSSILALCSLLVEDTGKFLEEMNEQLDYLFFEGRSNPSPSKIEYLLRLDDCRKASLKGSEQALELLANMNSSFKETHLGCPACEAATILSMRINETSADLEYLKDELKIMESKIDKMHKSINEKLGLEQVRRSTILAFLAALYIPLAFASSVLSMNIADSSIDSALNNATNQTLLAMATQPFNLTRQTELLATVISASGGATYSFGLFFGIAAALVAGSFILPIITGPIFRQILQSVDKHRSYLRFLYPVLFSVYIIGIYIITPIFGTKISFYYPYFTLSFAAFGFQLLLPMIAFLSMFQGRGPFRWFKGRGKLGVRSVIKRSLFVIFSFSCAFVPFAFFLLWPIGILPIIVLLWIWYGSSIKGLCARKWHALWHRRTE